MLIEYFYPFDHGGSEQSLVQLSKGLIEKGHNVLVVTPNYGTVTQEKWQGIAIERFWFPYHMRNGEPKNLTPLWFTNPLWYLLSSVSLLISTVRYKPDIVHVQSKSFLIPALVLKLFLRQRMVFTLRDYQLLCPYGLCLTKERGFNKCSFWHFLKYEQNQYVRDYLPNANFLKTNLLRIMGIYGWLTSYLLRALVHFIDAGVCISKSQRNIYDKNHILIHSVIYNAMKKGALLKKERGYDVLFVGRLTPGKGAYLFQKAVLELQQKGVAVTAAMIGQGFLKLQSSKSNIALLGQLSHEKTLAIISSSKVVVVPSLWEEPFGRVALEAIVCNTPVVVTNVGGLPEIISDKSLGVVVKPTIDGITKGIMKVLLEHKSFKRGITKQKRYIAWKFYNQPLDQYEKLYRSIQ